MKKSTIEIKHFCERHEITKDQFYGKFKIDGDFISNDKTLPYGINLDVVGDINLRSLATMLEGVTLTAGGSINLRSLATMPEGVTLTAGGYIYLRSQTIAKKDNVKPINFLTWKVGLKNYIKADGKFSEVVHQKGNIWKLKDVNRENYYYLVTDGEKFAHGETIKQAKADLIYKISNRDKSVYKDIDVSQKHEYSYCIEMYRVITGACAAGVKQFIESKGIKPTKFSVIDINNITNGAYGSESFKSFFNL